MFLPYSQSCFPACPQEQFGPTFSEKGFSLYCFSTLSEKLSEFEQNFSLRLPKLPFSYPEYHFREKIVEIFHTVFFDSERETFGAEAKFFGQFVNCQICFPFVRRYNLEDFWLVFFMFFFLNSIKNFSDFEQTIFSKFIKRAIYLSKGTIWKQIFRKCLFIYEFPSDFDRICFSLMGEVVKTAFYVSMEHFGFFQ